MATVDGGSSKFLGVLSISKCWGPSGGQFTYVGCGKLLKDGRPCGLGDLGLRARRLREQATFSSPSSISQPGTPGGRSRDRSGHTYVELGNHVQMYHFFVETLKPCHTLEVWDKAGEELFNMSAQDFFETFGQDVDKLREFVSSRLASQLWSIIVIGNPSFSGNQRVLSFSNTGCSSSSSGLVSTNTPSARVGVVKSRVNELGKDIAQVIASLSKLETDEEEFTESLTN
ncbi:hypothetical protein R1sor_005579 [Riccia sorocarpa]|uniref:Uncharacterized protein n=1 Tax=Riccia sorocarpa TaxID=122646 RepID=A0ABD3HKI1_9MARC